MITVDDDAPRSGILYGTGVHVLVDQAPDRVPDFDPRTGDHFWTVMTLYRIDPVRWTEGHPDGPTALDIENLIKVVGPGCFHCESDYTPELARRRCRGHG